MSNLYYIGLVPDEALSALSVNYKNHAEELFASIAAKKSPAHITLVPPFKATAEQLEQINLKLGEIAADNDKLELNVIGWNHFKERTIYMAIEATPALKNIFNLVFDQMADIVKPRGEKKFIPHISIINRDLPEGQFSVAFNFFNTLELPSACTCGKLVLFSLVNGKWRNSISYSLN